MAYEILKDENYRNLGGINTKISTYTTGPTEFLNLRNYTFVRPGTLTSRPGTEIRYTLPVSSFSMMPANNLEYIKNSGASFQLFDSGETLYTRGSNTVVDWPLLSPYGLSTATTGLTARPIDYVIQNDFLYYANGAAFRRFDGTYAVEWNVPLIPFDHSTANVTFNVSLIPVNGVTAVIPLGHHYFSMGGLRGTPTTYSVAAQGVYNLNAGPSSSVGVDKFIAATITSKGRWIFYGFNSNFGITNYPQYGLSTGVVNYAGPGVSVASDGSIFQQGSTTVLFGTTQFGGVTVQYVEFDNYTLGVGYDYQAALNVVPKYVQTFNNMLFFGNIAPAFLFSGAPSTLWYSRVGLPEQVDPENFVEIRSGNGDQITGLEVFQDSLIVFKDSSVHELVGTDPDSLSLRDVTLEYGCLNNRGIVTFENLMWFIDRKGIVEYNGANFSIVSEKIDSYLNQVDKSKITALHVKSANQVWFSASNKVFVYDYTIKAWTIYDNLPIDAGAGANVLSYGATMKEVTYWKSGSSFHTSVNFNSSLHTDLGNAISLVAQGRYQKRLGETTQELWRRLYINCDIPGSTQGLTVNFRPDYGSSIYLTRNMYLDQFQKRIDFGISAKSMSMEILISASQAIRINGYTVESRYLRSV